MQHMGRRGNEDPWEVVRPGLDHERVTRLTKQCKH
jgi:hypothetical protein